jgi:hypothetical protein
MPRFNNEELQNDGYKTHKAKRLERSNNRCEITGEPNSPESHHIVPKYLSGPSTEENFMVLVSNYHTDIHKITRSEHVDLIQKRNIMRKKLEHNPFNTDAIEEIREIDAVLIPEYITKMINGLPKNTKDIMLELTITRNFECIRDLAIETMQLRAKIQELQGKKNNRASKRIHNQIDNE